MSESTKRKFYNTGDAKGFTKAIFFETVAAMANGDEVDESLITLVGEAADYELEGISLRQEKAGEKATGEKKDPLNSEYAIALRAAILPLIGREPMTGTELSAYSLSLGITSSKGTAYAAPWISRALNRLVEDGEANTPNGEFIVVQKMVTSVSAKTGKQSSHEVDAYVLA